MTLRWSEHPAAREEFLGALTWYEDREPGLGNQLVDEISAGVAFIRAWPDAALLYRGRNRTPQIRRKSLDRFPYGIIYLVREREVVVIAYAHERRRPGYWRKRLRDI